MTTLWRNTRLRARDEKTIYVVGHRNPDTDSVVAATAYAALKRAEGERACVPVRAGNTTPQTEYVFNRFGMPIPEFLPDLIPRVAYYLNPDFETIGDGVSLWEAMSTLQAHDIQALPVVDADGKYHSLLHYSFFARKMVRINDPRQKTAIRTSVDLLASVLDAQALVVRNGAEIRKSPIIVAAAGFDTFGRILDTHIPENTIVVSGDRPDIQRRAVEAGVRALIITNGFMVDREVRDLAERRGVSILVSPYDTSSTTLLLIYSVPAACMSSRDLKPVNINDTVRKVAPLISSAPGKSLPVVDDSGAVVGVLSETDLYHEPSVRIILVDHNELSQAIEGAEHYQILEIIDHHRLGSVSTRQPITFINKPVGATCTIVAELYRERRVPLSGGMAAILLCGILADTLSLQSTTATDADRRAAEYLANITNLDIDELGRDLMAAASKISGRTAGDLIRQDMKAYREDGVAFAVSQVEVSDPAEILSRKAEFAEELESERTRSGDLFRALLVTDITRLSSLLLMTADPAFERTVALPRQEELVYVLTGVVSRKKQLMPILSEMVEKYLKG